MVKDHKAYAAAKNAKKTEKKEKKRGEEAEESKEVKGCHVAVIKGFATVGCVRPKDACPPINSHEGVKMCCSFKNCPYAEKQHIHTECFDKLSQTLERCLSNTGSARNWTKDQLHWNMWRAKGMDMIGNRVRCPCGNGVQTVDDGVMDVKLGDVFDKDEQLKKRDEQLKKAPKQTKKELPAVGGGPMGSRAQWELERKLERKLQEKRRNPTLSPLADLVAEIPIVEEEESTTPQAGDVDDDGFTTVGRLPRKISPPTERVLHSNNGQKKNRRERRKGAERDTSFTETGTPSLAERSRTTSIASSITDSLGGESAGGDFKHSPRIIFEQISETSPPKSKMVAESPKTAAVITRRVLEDGFPQANSYPNEPRTGLTRAENNVMNGSPSTKAMKREQKRDAGNKTNSQPQLKRNRYGELGERDDDADSGHGSPEHLLPMATYLPLRQWADDYFNQSEVGSWSDVQVDELNGSLELQKEEKDNFRCTVSGRTFKEASIRQFMDARSAWLFTDMAMSLKIADIPPGVMLTLQEHYVIYYGYEIKHLEDPVVVNSRGDLFPLECVEMITAAMP